MPKATVGKRTRKEMISDTMLDLGKLIFGGIVLAGIFESEFNKLVLVLGGLLLCFVLMTVAIYIGTKE